MPPLEGRIEGAVEAGGGVRELRLWFDWDELLTRFSRWGPVKQEIETQEPESPAEIHMDRMMDHLDRIHEAVRATEVDRLEDHVPRGADFERFRRLMGRRSSFASTTTAQE